MTELYLIRHGLAVERGREVRDQDRPLTEEGRYKTAQIAKRLRQLDLEFELIGSSPLVRAAQTAEILLQEGVGKRLDLCEHLAPGGRLEDGLAWLNRSRLPKAARVALVGHEPDLSAWAERLIWGEVRSVLRLKKAGMIGLMLPDQGSEIGQTVLFWLTPPKFLL
ncbi:phosphohistidine phosphatase SixA [Leptolyngbya sp. 'hensonii']|uniref:phosphohistidine phosphatase SixA n=1 Tax=Leptolyngbya sp. 'hensonii' TaxID=1922337 RepID=UPI00094F5301|nr:phosphohistidine phosphatase SixA [Leptolyngbya sp. 'hensonii']OLP18554.1 phosphohistidine phosphatase SixA [Leptolyngbya sp. 'hensonii']